MIIQLAKKKRLKSDSRQWTYQIFIKANNTEEGFVWKSKFFFGSLASAYEQLLKYFVRTSEKETLTEALEDAIKKLKKLRKEIDSILTIKL